MGKNVYFAYRSFWPELETTGRFSEAGINTVCFFSSNTFNSLGEPYCLYPPTWYGPDNYDFNPLDRQISDILSASPEAELICMVDLNTPVWAQRKKYCGNYDSHTELGHILHIERWRELTRDYLEAFLSHSEKLYSGRIKAYILACGGTCEWQDRTHGEESSVREQAFKKWCLEKGHEVPERIPSKEQRETTSRFMLRDPERDAVSLNYWKFCGEKVADTISYFIGKARKIIRSEAELGVFYGYIIELGSGRHVSEGYLEYEKLIKTPGLDFLIGPGTYRDREIGGGSGFMIPNVTLKNHGLSYLHECDQRTHTYNSRISEHARVNYTGWPDEESTIAGIKREMALCLVNRASLWWFDMWGGFYKGENVMKTFSSMKKIWDEFICKDYPPSSEIMMAVDPESSYYFDENCSGADEFIKGLRNKLNRTGAPYDICSFSDIETLPDISRYKFFIFPNLFFIDEAKMDILRRRVLKDGRTVLWIFAPGITDGKSFDGERVKEICGADYNSPGITETEMGSWKSVYANNPAEITPGLLKKISGGAGVHVYCAEEIPVYANAGLVAAHFNLKKHIRINLPPGCVRAVELYTGKTWEGNPSYIEWEAAGPETLLLCLEKY